VTETVRAALSQTTERKGHGSPVSRDAQRSSEAASTHHNSAHGGGPLNSLTISIGRLVFKCNVEVGRSGPSSVDDKAGELDASQIRPAGLRHRRHRASTLRATHSALARQSSLEDPYQAERTDGSNHEGFLASRSTSVNFWESLYPTEREALRSMASWRTFAAGARLMEEGERADYVMVILGGQVKICIDENGSERVLAVRGLGQLVGERGALKVSVRSATVIALDMIWALVVQTKDFAAFISAHPRVLDIVQNQLYQRHTEAPAGYGYDSDDLGGFRAEPANTTAAADQTDNNYRAGHSRRQSQPLKGENCTVFLTDVVGFGARTRTDGDRLLIRDALSRMTQAAMQGMPDAQSEDRGDGFLTVVPPNVSTARVIDQLLRELPAALELHNSTQRESVRFKLRLAVNVGPVVSDTMGVSGEAIIVVARLVEAPSFKKAIAESMVSLGVMASPFVYETVIRHSSNPSDVASYSRVPVEVKESDTTAWMKLFDAPLPSSLVPHPAAPEPRLGQLTRFFGARISRCEQRLDPRQGFPEVGLGGQVARRGEGKPAQQGVLVLRAGRVGGLGGHEEPDVGVLVRGFALAWRDVDDDHVPDLGVRPRFQVRQAGLLLRFPQHDGERVGLAEVAVAAHLEPGLLALVPAQQHPGGGRVHDQRGGGDVQREVALVRVGGGLGQRPHPLDVGRFGVALRAVAVQERDQVRHRTSMAAVR